MAWRQLRRVFVVSSVSHVWNGPRAVARLGNFTRAAVELGTTQAAVSCQIKLLEERAGTLLFLRRPKHTVLTDTCKALTPKVRDAFEMLC